MNNYKIYTFCIFLIISIVSCKKLTDVNNVNPVNQLSEDKAITSVSQAQSVLYGTYGLLMNGEIISYNSGLNSLRGLTMGPAPAGGNTGGFFQNNEVPTDDFFLDAVYTKFYQVINNANHVIEKTPLINSLDPRRDQIVGEARFIRALCHFYLLRNQGYFFDLSSKYGIVQKKAPVKSAISEPRSTVQENYDFIISDLDSAIAKAPSFSNTFFASSQAAMALKAKVLLYQKKYSEVIPIAKQVIQSGKFQLESNYSLIFLKKIMNTKEVLFQIPFDATLNSNNKAYMFRGFYLPSAYYANLLVGDNRDTAALVRNPNGTLRNKKYNNAVINGQTLFADTEYFLRLDETYLILSEAIVRSGGSLNEAKDSLNVIRKRVQMPNTTAVTKSQILEAIRVEKILELGAESGEEWFDLVRFAKEGDLDIKAFKPGVINETRYVLPLPKPTVQFSNNVVEQNPGY